ncbi:MAG TPA: hypothetical protein PK402_02360 [Tepidisphaeraceae bacterium]|nr:hypothetical protein [Tepidisphaeraceae bacterium]
MRGFGLLIILGFTANVVANVLAQSIPETVYPPPEPAMFDEEQALGSGIDVNFESRYVSDNIWRGIERFDDDGQKEDYANIQLLGKVALDLGKLPHPFIDLHLNLAEDDPESTLQEIRPTVGFDWTIRPLVISAGATGYIFPERDDIDTGEVFLAFSLDDSGIFKQEQPVLSPYVFGSYDYDEYDGVYIEAGFRHRIPIEETDLTLELHANVAYVNGLGLLFSDNEDDDSGFHHYQVGMTAIYQLNNTLNISERYGLWSIVGYINYNDGIDNDLNATTQLWGGAGIRLDF